MLETLSIVTPGSEGPDRRIVSLGKSGIYKAIMLYIITQIFLSALAFYGPQYLLRTEQYIPLSTTASYNRLFQMSAKNFDPFNRFLIEELCLFNTKNLSTSNFELKLQAHLYKSSKLVGDYHRRTQEYNISFPDNNKSEVIRLMSTPVINYDELVSSLTIKFLDKEPLPAKISIITESKSFSIITILLRSIVFVISLIILFSFSSKFNFSKASISNQAIFCLSIVMVFATNPFVILNYYTESIVLSLIDAFFSQFFFVLAAYFSFVHLFSGDVKNETPSCSLAIILLIPFSVAFALMFMHSCYSVVKVADDPVVQIESMWTGLAITRYILFGIYIPVATVAGVTRHSSVDMDQSTHLILIITLMLVTFITEVFAPLESFIGTAYAVQTYGLIATAVYVIFFSFFNWPTEADLEEIDKKFDGNDVGVVLDTEEEENKEFIA